MEILVLKVWVNIRIDIYSLLLNAIHLTNDKATNEKLSTFRTKTNSNTTLNGRIMNIKTMCLLNNGYHKTCSYYYTIFACFDTTDYHKICLEESEFVGFGRH